ncbi:MAG: MlaD family protein [Cyanobacteriota bacterium]|nr:MlaD family protein [Cyanobacteriota bacterium]
MMRSRAVREGAVGLLILGGAVTFAGLFIWIYNLRLQTAGYRFTLTYENVSGLAEGAAVRLRGVSIGRVERVDPRLEAVYVDIFVDNLQPIPRNADFYTSQTGLVGQTVIDIFPKASATLPVGAKMDPTTANCDPQVMVCAGSTLAGIAGVDYAQLITQLDQLADRINNDEFFENLNKTLTGVTEVSQSVAKLSTTVDEKIAALPLEDLDLAQFTAAAQSIQTTAADLSGVIRDNQAILTTSLTNVAAVSESLKRISSGLEPVLTDPELPATLKQTLAEAKLAAENAARATANLEELSASLNDPGTLATLRQTLDSARITFENAQKITADLDELTGDPQFRESLRNLVKGLSGLVSLDSPSTAPTALQSPSVDLNAASQPVGFVLAPGALDR